MKAADKNARGTIDAGKSYPLVLFRELTGLGEAAIRRCRRQGLQVVYVGRMAFVLGNDWLAFLEAAKQRPREY